MATAETKTTPRRTTQVEEKRTVEGTEPAAQSMANAKVRSGRISVFSFYPSPLVSHSSYACSFPQVEGPCDETSDTATSTAAASAKATKQPVAETSAKSARESPAEEEAPSEDIGDVEGQVVGKSCNNGDSESVAAEVDDSGRSVVLFNRALVFANVVLALGYAIGLLFQVYQFVGKPREDIAIAAYFLSFALLILSGAIELVVNQLMLRTVGHGRYHSESAFWNGVISGWFISAGILDIVGFVYWLGKDKVTENLVLLVSSYILLMMAIMAPYFQIIKLKDSPWSQTMKWDRIDLFANGLVVVTAVLGVVFRHMDHSGRKDLSDVKENIELATVPIFLFSSVLYNVSNALRVQGGELRVYATTASESSTPILEIYEA